MMPIAQPNNTNGTTWSEEAVREETYKRCALLWDGGIRKNVGKKFFGVIQFILSDEDEEYGSDWQKLVCKELMVPDYECERFWNECGKKTARTTINRRRQNTTMAMKKRFIGKVGMMDICRVHILVLTFVALCTQT